MAVIRRTCEGASRRSPLIGGLAGGFLLAFHLPVRAVNEQVQPADDTNEKFAPNAFIRINRSARVMPQVEMGQSIYTSIAKILAEELHCDLTQVTLEHAPPSDKLYGNPTFGFRSPATPIRSGPGRSEFVVQFWLVRIFKIGVHIQVSETARHQSIKCSTIEAGGAVSGQVWGIVEVPIVAAGANLGFAMIQLLRQ